MMSSVGGEEQVCYQLLPGSDLCHNLVTSVETAEVYSAKGGQYNPNNIEYRVTFQLD